MSYTRFTAKSVSPSGHNSSDIQCVRHVKGSRVNIRKQDPSVTQIGVRTMWLPNTIRYGPRTDDVEVRGLSRRYGSTGISDDFLYDADTDPEAFDAVSVLATVQRTLTMCRRSLRRSGRLEPLQWFWGSQPIQVWPWAGEMVNAFYQRDDRSLVFYHFHDETTRDRKTVYTCRSWDIVAHETGHAILDALQPQWLLDSIDNLQTGALNESFCDLIAVFGLLEQVDICEVVIAECKGDLTGPVNLLSCLGEEFGRACGLPFGIRNAQEDFTLANAPYSIHGHSKVFTGAIYDALVKIYASDTNLLLHDPAYTLHTSAMALLDAFLLAVVESPASQPTFQHVAERIITISPNKEHKAILTDEFTRRYIFDDRGRDHISSGIVKRSMESVMKASSTSPNKKNPGSAAERSSGADPVQHDLNKNYICGTMLAAYDEGVKADVSRAVHVLSVAHEQNAEAEAEVEEASGKGFAGARSTIVHVPWNMP